MVYVPQLTFKHWLKLAPWERNLFVQRLWCKAWQLLIACSSFHIYCVFCSLNERTWNNKGRSVWSWCVQRRNMARYISRIIVKEISNVRMVYCILFRRVPSHNRFACDGVERSLSQKSSTGRAWYRASRHWHDSALQRARSVWRPSRLRAMWYTCSSSMCLSLNRPWGVREERSGHTDHC